MNSSRFWTRRMSTSEAGRKPRTPRSRMRPPLTTSITVPSTGSPDSRGGLDPAPGLLEAGALLGEDQAPLLVLLGEDERVDLLAELDLLGRVHRLADRELVGGDDALRLVADVDEDLVLVDAHDLAADHVALARRGGWSRRSSGRACRRPRSAGRGADTRAPLRSGATAASGLRASRGLVLLGASLVRRWLSRSRHEQWSRQMPDSTVQADAHGHPPGASPLPRRSLDRCRSVRTKSGDERTPARRRLRRDRLRRQLRRPDASPGSWPARARECCCSIATRSASARPRPAASPPPGSSAMGLEGSNRQEFGELVVHTPARHLALRPALDLLDLRLPRALPLLDDQNDAEFETAKVNGRTGEDGPHRPRRRLRPADRGRARLAADSRRGRRLPAAGRSALARARGASRRRLATTSRSGSTAATCPPATAGASLRATSSGSASAPSTRASTSRTPPCCWPRTSTSPRFATRATGSRTSSARRPRTGSSSSATPPGHCLPLTAEGIRTAFYFGIKLRRRAARGRRGRAGPRRTRSATTPSSSTRTSGSSAGCCAPRGCCRSCRRAPSAR